MAIINAIQQQETNPIKMKKIIKIVVVSEMESPYPSGIVLANEVVI